MVEYDLAALKKFLKDISVITDSTVTFYDEYFRNYVMTTSSPLPEGAHSPCAIVSKYENQNCILSDNYIFNQLSSKNLKSYYSSCHIGLSMIGFRLIVSNNPVGYVLLGPFREERYEKSFLKRIEQFCQAHDCSLEETIRHYYKVPVLTERKFEAISNIFNDMFQYIVSNESIILKSNFFFDTILAFVEKNLDQDLTIDYMCKNLYLSKKQLYNYFIKETGLPPKQFVMQLKMREAKVLILTTSLSLSKVAEAVGMSDYNYFIKVFKNHHGYSPSFYRKKIKKEA